MTINEIKELVEKTKHFTKEENVLHIGNVSH